jgi:hypothetical protein
VISGVSERRGYGRGAGLVGDLLTEEFLTGPYASSHTDDFDDNSFDWVKWPNSYGAVAEVGGRARVPTTTSYSGLATQAKYSFDQVFARWWPPALNGGTFDCYFAFFVQSAKQNTAVPGTDVGVIIDVVNNTLSFINWVSFSDANTVAIPYDPVAHAWFRLRMASGQLLYETAPDGLTWTVRRTLEQPPTWLINSDMQLFFESHRGDGTTNFAEVDSFNIAPSGGAVSGTAAANLGGLTATALGVRSSLGATTTNLGGLTATAVGVRSVTATATADLGGLSATGAGTVTAGTTDVTGTAAATLAGLTATAAGVRQASGATATTLGALTATAAGFRTVPGTTTITLGALTATAGGSRTTSGPAAANLGALTAAAVGEVARSGMAAATLGALVAAANGVGLTVSKVTLRPSTGTTARPSSTVTTRPLAGTTARP